MEGLSLIAAAGAIMKKVKTVPPFRSTHGLDFEDGGPFRHDPSFRYFRVGTVEGLWGGIGKSYVILAITNIKPGNGHFLDALEWFEQSCRRDGYSLKVIEIMNARFMKHLIEKRGFVKTDVDACEKVYSL
jgi:hypothetical protein